VSDAPSDHSAPLAVFGTYELLEDVLSYLPLKDLFILQRVSKQWSKVIADSPRLQEHMFLRLPSATPKETWFGVGVRDSPYTHDIPSGGYLEVPAGDPIGFRRVKNSSTTYKKLYRPTTLNPVFQMSHPHHSTLKRLAHGQREAVSIRVRLDALYERSSLWKMYVTNSPCQSARIKLPVEPTGGSRIESDEGLTVGDILGAAVRAEDDHCFGPDQGPSWRAITVADTWYFDPARRIGYRSSHSAESFYDVDFVTLCIDLLRDGGINPVIPSEAERATMVFSLI
jgi:hypothetical protein